MKTLTFTGHRPERLGLGYNLNAPEYDDLRNKIKSYIVDNEFTDIWVGMALGTDTLAALVALELKSEGYKVNLHCAIPCHDYDCKWVAESKRVYANVLEQADEVVYVTDGPYDEFCLSKRNYFMVDNCDEVFAVWDKKLSGGTYESISYARYKEKPIHVNWVIKTREG